MKKIDQTIMVLFTACMFITCIFTACTDAVEKTDLSKPTDDIVWANAQYVKRHFDYIMNEATPHADLRQTAHSDEGYVYEAGRDVIYDNININDINDVDRWPYTKLREINRFLDHAGYDGFVSPKPITANLPLAEKEDMIGHLLVLRAYHYFDMVRTYGGVPLLLHEQQASTNMEDMYTARAKTSECVAQIVRDLDAAIALPDASFPMKRGDGHISKAVAYALKGRVLLYYASPQFTRQTPAGTKSIEQRRNEAYAACKEAFDKLQAAGYGLYLPDGGDRETVMDNYYKMLVADEMNMEMVWVRRYHPIIANNGMDANIRPNSSARGSVSPHPIWEMAAAFANADGTPFVPAVPVDNSLNGVLGTHTQGSSSGNMDVPVPDGSPMNTSVFWLDREPRFYAFIGYNGCRWPLFRKEQSLMSGDIANGKMQHEWIFCWGNNDQKYPFDKGYSPTNGRGLSFNIRKFVSDALNYEIADPTNPLQSCGTDLPLIRFAEVALNYAEAAAVTGKANEAYEILDAIRKRAGIPEGSNHYGIGRKTGDALILDILNERRIELYFESHRYYDARRWDLYANGLAGYKINGMRRHAIQAWLRDVNEANNKPALAAKLQAVLDAGGIETQAGRDAYFNVFYHVAMLHDYQPISYNPARQDFLRIQYAAHIMKNPTIEQTMGWTDERGPGTFNPYE
jgi:hypothetical protein